MANSQNVLFRLRQLVTLDEEGAENALPLCGMCLEDVKCRLRSDANADDPRVAQAAAALACYRLAVRNAAENGDKVSFKAGDVTVSRTPASTVEFAAAMRDDACLQAVDLFEDNSFVFRQVGK